MTRWRHTRCPFHFMSVLIVVGLFLTACSDSAPPAPNEKPPQNTAPLHSQSWRIEGFPAKFASGGVKTLRRRENTLLMEVNPADLGGPPARPFVLSIAPWGPEHPLPDCPAEACRLTAKIRFSAEGPKRLLTLLKEKRPQWWLGQGTPVDTELPGGWKITDTSGEEPAGAQPAGAGKIWTALMLASVEAIKTASPQPGSNLVQARPGQPVPLKGEKGRFYFILLGASRQAEDLTSLSADWLMVPMP